MAESKIFFGKETSVELVMIDVFGVRYEGIWTSIKK